MSLTDSSTATENRGANLNDEQTGFPQFLILAVCFSVFLIFNSFILWNLFSFMDGGAISEAMMFPLGLSCFLSNSLGFIFIAVLIDLFPRLLSAPLHHVASALLILGFTVLVYAVYSNSGFVALYIVAGTLIGFSSSCIFVFYAQVFSSINLRSTQIIVLIASVLMVLFHLASQRIPLEFLFIFLVFILAPLTIISLYLAKRNLSKTVINTFEEEIEDIKAISGDGQLPLSVTDKQEVRHKSIRQLMPRLWVPLLCVMMISIISPAFATLSQQDSLSPEVFTALSLLGTFVAVIVLAVSWFGLKRHLSITSYYVVLTPIFATAILLVPLFGRYFAYSLFWLGAAGFCLISILVMTESIREATREGTSVIVLFGVYSGVMYLSRSLGYLLGNFANRYFDTPPLQYAAVALLLLYGLSIVVVIILRKSRRLNLVAQTSQNADKTNESLNSDSAKLPIMGSFDQKCALIAQQKQLTDRGTEIMKLLAHGRSVPHIAQILYLSENTVRTHTKKIYQTLSVHSRQEMLDLIDNTKLG